MQRFADLLLWLSLALWLAFALVGGLAAMAIFPEARELPLSLEGYEAFIAAEPTQGRQLVAGFLVERVFTMSNTPRILAAVVAAIVLAGQLLTQRHPAHPRLRLAALALAGGAMLVSILWAMPAFQSVDRAYREAAAAGQVEEALAQKPSVDAAHATASRLATTEVAALLALIGLTAISGGRRG
ncbi:MAG: hypothetical protein RL136_1977 [Planctomycetota bacterium]